MSKSQPKQAQATSAMETVGSLAGTMLSVSNRSHMWRTKFYGGSIFISRFCFPQITESNEKSTKHLIKLSENTTLQLQNGELLLLKNLRAVLKHSTFTQLILT